MDEKSSTVSSSNETTNKTKNKRKPEMVRYQPPNSRNNSSNNTKNPLEFSENKTEQSSSSDKKTTESKAIKSYKQQRDPESENKNKIQSEKLECNEEPAAHVVESQRSQCNLEAEKSQTDKTLKCQRNLELEHDKVIKPHAGLLKLNTQMTNQIKAIKEAVLTSTPPVDDATRQAKEYCKNFRNLKYDSGRGHSSNNNQESNVKMLFNPNNPDKPIFKKIQNSKQREIRF